MTNISRIEAHTSSTEAIAELSAELAEALEPTAKEAAEYARRYWQLKNARYVTDDGEVIERWKHDRECAELNKLLRAYVEAHGVILVEGQPPLGLQPRSERWYGMDLMLREDLELVSYLAEHGWLNVAGDARLVARTDPRLMGLKKYEHSGAATALTFDKREHSFRSPMTEARKKEIAAEDAAQG